MATSGDQAAIAWHGDRTGRDAIHFEWLTASGRPTATSVQVTDGSHAAYEPDLQLADGDPVLAWYEKDTATGALSAWLARLDRRGVPVWRVRLDGAGGRARNPVVRAQGGSLFAAWIESPTDDPDAAQVWTQTFALDGRSIEAARAVAPASRKTWNLNAAVDARGVFYLVYDSAAGAAPHELQLVAVDGASIRRRQLTASDGKASLYPDLQISRRGQAAVTWFDERDGNQEVYLAVLPAADLLRGDKLPARRITHTDAPSIGAYLAWNGDRLALVWCDAQAGQNELYAQFFDARGNPRPEIWRLTSTAAESSIPSIRPIENGFLIGWNEYSRAGVEGHGEDTPSEAMTMRLN